MELTKTISCFGNVPLNAEAGKHACSANRNWLKVQVDGTVKTITRFGDVPLNAKAGKHACSANRNWLKVQVDGKQ
jgi:hypothetical protein